ncbi:MAG: M3 family metallopeptidase [Epsilonproteobacteria bacterium]|nr:M3 family metallopeptidase [Campylobacterota bacterium]
MFVEFEVNNLKNFPNELEKLLEKNKKTIDNIAKNGKNYKEVIKELDDISENLDRFFTPLSHLNSVNNSKETQEAYEKSIPLLSNYYSFISKHTPLYQKIKSLTPTNELEKRVIELEVRDFKLSGVELDEEKKKRLEEINLRLSELSNKFSQNLLDSTNEFEIFLDEKDIKGMPQSDIDIAKIKIEEEIKYRFTLQMPSYIAYMSYGPNREIRQKLYRAYNTRAANNQEVIDEILRLRFEKANLLGFKNYASYALATRDAKSEEDVLNFLYELLDASKEQAKKELKELEEFAKRVDNIDKLMPYDLSYYSEKLKKEKFDFDESKLKPYFEQERVVNGMLELVGELFEVEFKRVYPKVWHKSVKVYDILEKDKTIARIYFDLEARESKRGGAWMHNWQSHYIDKNNNEQLASAFVVANFAPATSTTPSLLRFDDVVTLFHEMGHAIHHLFSKVSERSISGIEGVAWDVVEFPSQFLENFAYESEIIKRFAFHYQTNEPISDELIKKIKATKNFNAALFMLRQIEFSLFDFMLHQKLYQGKEVNELLNNIRKKTSLLEVPEYVRFEHGFAHIFAGGYGAGYYSYKWAEVFSADAFFECLDKGNFNKIRAKEYKEHILEKGASKDMSKLYYEWLKRRPKSSSLIKLYEINNDKK